MAVNCHNLEPIVMDIELKNDTLRIILNVFFL